MRETSASDVMECRAIAGTHVVVLAWDFVKGQTAKRKGLMGFAIERSELQNGDVTERYWLRSIKRFKDKDKGLPPGTPVPTNEHPIQSFQWADYTAEQGITYIYRIVPTYGTPKNLLLDEASGVAVEITTEPQMTEKTTKEGTHHDVFFNRGVIGSQAYARRFQNSEPDPDDPLSQEMAWLSRGLFEGLLGFIGLAKNATYGLRAALYEFHYQPVANAFTAAIEAGADVKIVYDAESSYKEENNATIGRARLDAYKAVIPRTVSTGIRHNKFIVLTRHDKPVAVWTGSTNISDGGIFGHSNVGHVVWDHAVADAYLQYWQGLADNLTPSKLRPLVNELSPLPDGEAPEGVTPLFSPRDGEKQTTTLQWYADRMAEATRMVCLTVAFNLDEVFQKVLNRENDVLRYVVKDDNLRDSEIIERDRDVLFAAGGYLGGGALANFLGERGNPLNSNDYIHTKFMLIDPLSDDPMVVTGSANFSRPSQITNDENMLVIRGDTRVADIYFGEYMRIFDHHYARYLVRKLTREGKSDPNAGYLKVKGEEWVASHFDKESPKSKRRRYFLGD